MRLEIDLWAWPFLWLEEKDKLPTTAGVYVAVCKGEVLYVGQSGNIRARWRRHGKLEELSAYPYIRVGWIEIAAADERNAIEVLLWERHDPPLNRVKPCPSVKGGSAPCGGIRFRLLELLQEKGKTLYWLQQETGVSYPALLRYAHNKVRKPDLVILEKICRALGCGLNDLLEMSD